MTPLPAPLSSGPLAAWRLDQAKFAATWDGGEGSYKYGGRWNSPGVRTVYCSLDHACAILEIAAHKGFNALDTVPHVLTAITLDPSKVHVVQPTAVPNSNWLKPGTPSTGQQKFGDALLSTHALVVIPSTVSTHSWNLIFVSAAAAGAYAMQSQEAFALDTRLNPPPSGP